jgi:serine/threonine protein kinase
VKLGRYELGEKIGAGAMGEVWRARDTHLHRDVAVKILPPQMAADREWKQRFLREARIAARLNHPGIVTIFSVADDSDETMYIAMELVEGRDLGAVLESGPLPADEVRRIGTDAAMALHEAHHAGIIHRDVKPENIVVTRRGVKVLDFGLAKDHRSSESHFTTVNTVLGTPLYMSPEQALGRRLDARSDIFSLGAVLYEAISGKSPFDGGNVHATLMNVVTLAHAPLRGVPRALAHIIDRCLQKSADQRWPTAFELAEALVNADLTAGTTQPQVRVRIGPPPRALVVDDDELVRIILQGMLADAGFAVDEASNGSEAITQLKANEYDAMFLDLLMPRVDGWTVLDYLRKSIARRPRNVYITSGVRDLKLSEVDASVVTSVLRKPLQPGVMMDLAARLSP